MDPVHFESYSPPWKQNGSMYLAMKRKASIVKKRLLMKGPIVDAQLVQELITIQSHEPHQPKVNRYYTNSLGVN